MRLAPAPTPELEALRASRLRRFRAYWSHATSSGHVALLRRQDGQRRLVEMVQKDLAEALWPTEYWHPSPPLTGRGQPGPKTNHPYDRVTPEQVAAYVAEDPFYREALTPRVAADLAYIESFKPTR